MFDDGLPTLEGRFLADRFEVRRKIGTGRLGTVLAAFDRQLGREVAIRVLPPSLLRDERAWGRFLLEVQPLCEHGHPGMVGILEVARDGELHLIAMEMVKGITLRKEMEAHLAAGRRFSVAEAVHIGRALCEALGHIHEHTIHGAVRPENVLLCDDGMVKLTDVGIDRLLGAGEVTTAGMPMRAVPYMAPEHLRAFQGGARAVDAAQAR